MPEAGGSRSLKLGALMVCPVYIRRDVTERLDEISRNAVAIEGPKASLKTFPTGVERP
ncbi:hypothetical protein M404DRAFT_992760 [Pisolithus tinctorius Marx 270]|uniref:Uncharacterized protein n=1 Tax=Pisolithus tinctorius Marx 270 TaxID=870435 RepID=A0A0C3PGS4_PISTI|nr:hypothetical protein M404DRAFT_992760 [Pisolithus tinctorius Marx 270]